MLMTLAASGHLANDALCVVPFYPFPGEGGEKVLFKWGSNPLSAAFLTTSQYILNLSTLKNITKHKFYLSYPSFVINIYVLYCSHVG